MESLVESRAKPVHAVIHCVFNFRMPVGFGEKIIISNDVAD